MSNQLLTAEQLALRWQIPKSHCYRLAREGQIPCVQLGRYRRFRLEDIEAFEKSFTYTEPTRRAA